MSFRSASLWGCELKYYEYEPSLQNIPSASLWGCELKCCDSRNNSGNYCQPPCEAVSWNAICIPILFLIFRQPPCEAVSWNSKIIICVLQVIQSASLWGCELKWIWLWIRTGSCRSASLWGCELKSIGFWVTVLVLGQPPCEAVSWNRYMDDIVIFAKSQPPCEAVSWNIYMKLTIDSGYMSASLWGCELKCY